MEELHDLKRIYMVFKFLIYNCFYLFCYSKFKLGMNSGPIQSKSSDLSTAIDRFLIELVCIITHQIQKTSKLASI